MKVLFDFAHRHGWEFSRFRRGLGPHFRFGLTRGFLTHSDTLPSTGQTTHAALSAKRERFPNLRSYRWPGWGLKFSRYDRLNEKYLLSLIAFRKIGVTIT
jgi:hypothetical protein